MAIDRVKVWARYQILEEEFIKYERYVPYSLYHSTITSPILDELLIRICTLLESFFKDASHCMIFDNNANNEDLDILRNNPKKASIRNIESVFNDYYLLSPKDVHYIYPVYQDAFYPFMNWSQHSSPDWWANYNTIKHNGFKKSASYENVRNALGGLFLSIVSHVEMINYLVAISAINGHGFKKIEEYLINETPRYTNIYIGYNSSIDVHSKLFGYIYKYYPIGPEDAFIKKIFTPPYDIFSDDFKDNDRLIWEKSNKQP